MLPDTPAAPLPRHEQGQGRSTRPLCRQRHMEQTLVATEATGDRARQRKTQGDISGGALISKALSLYGEVMRAELEPGAVSQTCRLGRSPEEHVPDLQLCPPHQHHFSRGEKLELHMEKESDFFFLNLKSSSGPVLQFTKQRCITKQAAHRCSLQSPLQRQPRAPEPTRASPREAPAAGSCTTTPPVPQSSEQTLNGKKRPFPGVKPPEITALYSRTEEQMQRKAE